MKLATLLAGAALLASVSIANAAPEAFALDKTHTHIGLTWNHLGFSQTRARFTDFTGSLVLDEAQPENSSLEVTIPIASLDTNVEKLDNHLQSADFFDAGKFPTATFKSTAIELVGDDKARVTGDLTIKGVTKPAVLHVHLNKLDKHPMSGKRAAGFTATTVIKRSDYGITQYVPMVSDEIELFISTEAHAE